MKRLLQWLERWGRPLPPVPFMPFHPDPMTPQEIAKALADRQDDPTIRAVFLLVEGNMRAAVRDMAQGTPEGRGAWIALEELWTELEKFVRGGPAR